MKSKKAILLVNLGTPENSDVSSVKKYLAEFLMDKKVIGAPFLIRWILVNLIIIPLRIHKVVEKYKSIWLTDGSPLMVYSNSFFKKFSIFLKSKENSNTNSITITTTAPYLAMRYGEPSMEKVINKMKSDGIENVRLIPLYPQYAEATSGTVIEKFQELLLKENWNPKVEIINPFYNKKPFLDESVQLISESFQNNQTDVSMKRYLLFSFHGLPESQIKRVDGCHINSECCLKPDACAKKCYRAQCLKTAELIANQLGLAKNEWSVSFQSRVGPTKWLGPSTESEIQRLASESQIKPIHLFIHCPSFVADCLETLEEINIEARKHFLQSGGKRFTFIPCLNDRDSWVQKFTELL